MAVASNRGRSELQRKWKERENTNTTSPERTKAWSEPTHSQSYKLKPLSNSNHVETILVVPVVYYLSRNGQLEHPHFMEVALSSPDGLFLRDVINRLNLLRGKGIAFQYSWSSKRSYKNGYVWHDLEENDFIHPVHGGEYVLKGSEILEMVSPSSVSKSPETSSSSSAKNTPGDPEFPVPARNRRRNQSWGAIDLHEYKVYKTESTREFGGKAVAADASTQTDDKRRRRIKEEPEGDGTVEELSREEISPPPSDSSPETLESLMKADGRLILTSSSSSSQPVNQADQPSETGNRTAGYCPSGRMKASSVLMSLISCGSVSFRDCGVTAVKDHGFSLITHYKTRLPRGGNQTGVVGKEMIMSIDDVMSEIENNASSSFAKMALEDKEYFSGSLIETKKNDFPATLKRSSSYNADRSSHMKMGEKEEEGVRARCIPSRPKTQASGDKLPVVM